MYFVDESKGRISQHQNWKFPFQLLKRNTNSLIKGRKPLHSIRVDTGHQEGVFMQQDKIICLLSLQMWQKGSWSTQEQQFNITWVIMAEQLEENRFLNSSAFSRKSRDTVPQRGNFGEKAGKVYLLSYIWNTEKIRVIQLQRSSVHKNYFVRY